MVLQLAVAKSVFDADQERQLNFRKSLAEATNTTLADITIVGTTAVTTARRSARRRLLAEAVDVTTQIRTQSAVPFPPPPRPPSASWRAASPSCMLLLHADTV